MNPASPMRLEVVTPGEVMLDRGVSKVSAESPQGAFTLLPRHVDFVAILVPGLIAFMADGDEHLMAVDGGVLIKRGPVVRIATGEAAEGDSVLALQRALRASFEELAEGERRSRAALVRLETDLVRRSMEMSEYG
jgi:F-type H+-transporting ATPase subunit epsilon